MDNLTISVTPIFPTGVIKGKLSPWMYFTVGTVLSSIWVIGFTTNLAVLCTFMANKKLRTTDTSLIIGLALSDIGQAVLGIPFVIISSFKMKWIFGAGVCQFYGFITTLLGITQITTLTFIAIERYFIIVRYRRTFSKTLNRCAIVIGCSFANGLFWATGPLIGWSSYKLEDSELACCLSWEAKNNWAMSYSVSISTVCWFIPLLIIICMYLRITCTTYKERIKMKQIRRQQISTNRNIERKVATTILMMIGAFVVSWMPYSVVTLWSTFGDFNTIPIGLHVAPAIFAKCSIIWNPLIYVARHKTFRQGVFKSLPIYKFWKEHGDSRDRNCVARADHFAFRNVEIVLNSGESSVPCSRQHSPALTLRTLSSQGGSTTSLVSRPMICHRSPTNGSNIDSLDNRTQVEL